MNSGCLNDSIAIVLILKIEWTPSRFEPNCTNNFLQTALAQCPVLPKFTDKLGMRRSCRGATRLSIELSAEKGRIHVHEAHF